MLGQFGGSRALEREIPAFLIGQLGRNANIDKTKISGNKILDYAIDTILEARKLVGGRVIILECQDENKLIEFYEKNKFVVLQKQSNGSKKENLIQMIRAI
jgi:hypothetical protein